MAYRHVQDPSSSLSSWTSTNLVQSVQAHVESFNTMITHVLPLLPSTIQDVFYEDAAGTSCRIYIQELQLSKPSRKDDSVEPRVFPYDCREAHATYAGELIAKVGVDLDGVTSVHSVSLGAVPMMVGSIGCYLHGATPEKLVSLKEDPDERGGYFIVNGNEKVVRLLVQNKANQVHALVRPSFANRGALYTKYATQMRCLRQDLTSQTLTLHYRKDGTCWMRFSISKNEYLLPMVLLLRAMGDFSDQILFEKLTDGDPMDTFVSERVLAMLEANKSAYGQTQSQSDALSHLGDVFATVLDEGRRKQPLTTRQIGQRVIQKFMFVHTQNFQEKFQSCIFMFRKLISLVRGDIRAENADTLDAHDVLLPGQLYGAIIKEAVEISLQKTVQTLAKKQRQHDMKVEAGKAAASTPSAAAKITATSVIHLLKASSEVEKRTSYFLSTGNLNSKSGLDLMQVSGFVTIADKLNAFRYFSHFRSIHRGAFFAEMKTTTPRKLNPETWGFLCPVHTPDGAPCGLLNHLTALAKVTTAVPDPESSSQAIKDFLYSHGVLPIVGQTAVIDGARHFLTTAPIYPASSYSWVVLDGRPIGKVHLDALKLVAEKLRSWKRQQNADFEIVGLSRDEQDLGLFSALSIFTGPGRLTRPVVHNETQIKEWIGPAEQVHLKIAVGNEHIQKFEKVTENLPVIYTHSECGPTSMFSYLAALTPFCNHNQSPRNMYQCQMLKQTMGTPYLNHPFRTDNKVYRITHPQAPIIRTKTFTESCFDIKPFGCNAVIAVISHTGYDMEDALVINRSSYNRGFGHATVFKQKLVDANELAGKFGRFASDGGAASGPLEADGLPRVGCRISEGSPYACVTNTSSSVPSKEIWKDDEDGWVEQVNVISGGGFGSQTTDSQMASIKVRLPRNPVVGDKFASRHGQKGVVGILVNQEDMPFTASGITPDILFNPHGFPSRMTIGMLIETMAGKAASLEGTPVVDATAFKTYPDGQMAHSESAEILAKHGYHYLGTEQMYSGMHGTPIETQIFVGLVYYQRLRHMVLDKAQVRATGPIDPLTMQPVKGRKRHGGIRFGEMERDSIISHGAAYLLRDRLFHCSDGQIDHVCPKCGSLLSGLAPERDTEPVCMQCNVTCERVEIPFVFRYLSAELASMNVKIKLNLKKIQD
jgi:DNA-directed RNA polymerase I subunit RPA2